MKFVNVKRKQLIHLILGLDFEQKTGLEYLQTNSSLPLMLSEKISEKGVWVCSFLVKF